MARFFFHVRDDDDAIDEEGCELPSLEQARLQAITGARSLAATNILEGHLNLGHRIEITDASGAILDSVTFRDAIAVEG